MDHPKNHSWRWFACQQRFSCYVLMCETPEAIGSVLFTTIPVSGTIKIDEGWIFAHWYRLELPSFSLRHQNHVLLHPSFLIELDLSRFMLLLVVTPDSELLVWIEPDLFSFCGIRIRFWLFTFQYWHSSLLGPLLFFQPGARAGFSMFVAAG